MPRVSWAEVGQLALDLTLTDRQVLGWLASHPFLTAEDLALVFDWDPRRARHLARRLLHRRLARLVTADEVGTALATPGRLEATVAGVLLAAADMGLSVSTAVKTLLPSRSIVLHWIDTASFGTRSRASGVPRPGITASSPSAKGSTATCVMG